MDMDWLCELGEIAWHFLLIAIVCLLIGAAAVFAIAWVIRLGVHGGF